jgi:hypothetical protein
VNRNIRRANETAKNAKVAKEGKYWQLIFLASLAALAVQDFQCSIIGVVKGPEYGVRTIA